jgi:hypothetical protein
MASGHEQGGHSVSQHYEGEPIIDPEGEPYEEPGYGPDKTDFHDGTDVEEPDAEAYEANPKDWTAEEPGLTMPLNWRPGESSDIGDYVEPKGGQQDVPPEETYSVPSTNVDQEDDNA